MSSSKYRIHPGTVSSEPNHSGSNGAMSKQAPDRASSIVIKKNSQQRIETNQAKSSSNKIDASFIINKNRAEHPKSESFRRQDSHAASSQLNSQSSAAHKPQQSQAPDDEDDIPRGCGAFLRSLLFLQSLFGILLVGIPVVLVFLTWAIGFGISTTAMIEQVRTVMFAQMFNQVLFGILQAEQLATGTFDAVRSGMLNVTTAAPSSIDSYILGGYQELLHKPLNTSGIVTICMGLADGSLRGIIQDGSHQNIYYSFNNWYSVNSSKLYYVPFADINSGTLDFAGAFDYDYTIADGQGAVWYNEATRSTTGTARWTSTYTDPGYPGQIFSSVVVPLMDNSGNMVSYVDVDRTSGSLQRVLKEMAKYSEGNIAIIIEANTNNLIATSQDSAVYKTANGAITRIKSTDFSDEPLVQLISKALVESYGNDFSGLPSTSFITSAGPAAKEFQVNFNGNLWAINAGILSRNNLNWVVITGFAQINLSRSPLGVGLAASSFVIIALVVALVSNLVFTSMSLKPLKRMIDQFELAENLQLSKISREFSKLAEIAEMQAYFFRLVDRMKLYRSFLPQNLLESLEGEAMGEEEVHEPTPIPGRGGLVKPGVSAKAATRAIMFTNRAAKGAPAPGIAHQASMRSHNSDHSRSSIGASHRSSRPTPMRMDIGLDMASLTICSVNLDNFMNMLNHEEGMFGVGELMELYGQVLDVVQKAARTYKGQVVSFNGNCIIVYWQNVVPKTQLKAVNCAVNIEDAVRKINTDLAQQQQQMADDTFMSLGAAVSMVVTTGQGHFGNVGSNTQRQFVVIGHIADQLARLQALCRAYGCRMLIDGDTKLDVEKEFNVRPLLDLSDYIAPNVQRQLYHRYPQQLDHDIEQIMQPVVDNMARDFMLIRDRPVLYELGTSIKAHDGEWMYEMTAEQQANKWTNFIAAISQVLKRDFQGALDFIQQHHAAMAAHAAAIQGAVLGVDRPSLITRQLIQAVIANPQYQNSLRSLKSQGKMTAL